MAKNKPQNVKNHPAPPTAALLYDFQSFKNKYTWVPAVLLVLFSAIFLYSIFKNIAYPLFWADESMTAMGTERVLQFGYPKVHDGKNVFYDLRHSNPKLGINDDDAYIGGTGWGHYYFGTIGYKLAASATDVYEKTAVFRSTFAVLGLLGIALLVFSLSQFFTHIFDKLSFAALFVFLCLLSVSLGLLLREVRYYSLTMFEVCALISLFSLHRILNKVNVWVYAGLTALLLWAIFITFAPVYFIMLGAILAMEAILWAFNGLHQKNIPLYIQKNYKSWVGIVVSVILVFPFIQYFKTFEISKAMAEFNGYSSKMYSQNLATVWGYFTKFELLYLAIILKLIVFTGIKKHFNTYKNLYLASVLFLVLFVVYTFLIARIPNFIYTRYIIYLQPVVVASALFDFFILMYFRNQKNTSLLNFSSVIFGLLLLVGIFVHYQSNQKNISGRWAELAEPVKGPLDYTIPAIIEKYKKTDTLIVATNYEETSYMYYLQCKATVGFIGNNLEEDAEVLPHVISYRKPWGNFTHIFQGFMRKAVYLRESYPVYDSPLNTIPELNFMPAFNRKFKTQYTENEQEKTDLYFRQ